MGRRANRCHRSTEPGRIRTKMEGKTVKKVIVALVIGALTVSVAVSSAVAKPTKKSASADICVLLPDPKSSVRWETQDRPALVAAFKKAGVSYVITNADGDAQKQKTQADQCLANGAKVVILVSLDKGSSIAIEAAAEVEGREGDRVRPPGGRRHRRDLHLLRQRRAVGVLQGKGVVNGLKKNGMYSKKPVVAELNGGQTDNNSFLFKGGYDSVLKPAVQERHPQEGPGSVHAWLGQPEGGHDLRADARQDEQQDRRGRRGQRRPRERSRRRAEGAQAEADPAERSGCDRAGRPEHHLRLADDDGLEGHAEARDRVGGGGRSPSPRASGRSRRAQ